MEWIDVLLNYDIGVAALWIVYLIREERRTQDLLEEIRREFQEYTEAQTEKWQTLILSIRETRNRQQSD